MTSHNSNFCPASFCFIIEIKSKPAKNIHMKFSTACTWILFIVMLSSCASVKNIPKYQLTDGYYKSKLFNTKHRIVYVDNNGDTISVYQADRKTKSIDMFTGSKKIFPKQT